MTLGNIVYVHDVQPGLDIGRHAPRRRICNHLAGGRRLDVARSDRGRRVDDDDRHPVLADKLEHSLFRFVF